MAKIYIFFLIAIASILFVVIFCLNCQLLNRGHEMEQDKIYKLIPLIQ